MEASAKEYLRKSLQGECRDGLHADRHDRTAAALLGVGIYFVF